MTLSLDAVRARVLSQKERLPSLYGDFDFDALPERFTDAPSLSDLKDRSFPGIAVRGEDLALVRHYTMLGDVVADAYAALLPRYGFHRLVAMLTTACAQGVDAVPDAPPELAAFIGAMEATPDWVDMGMVREGARLMRNDAANVAPLAIRGAFLATFLNKYAALPMALTGALGHASAARRVNETATFFAVTTLPGAMERHGEGFKAAAMVRLMHSMVRVNALRSGRWDRAVYGVPIPQVDQMPAGLIWAFLRAYEVVRAGRGFTREERAQVEFHRYRCFLLGLPEDLLSDTPEGILSLMIARGSTLRAGFDDETCGALIRATLSAYLPPDRSLKYRAFDAVERRFSTGFFVRYFLQGDVARAAAMGVELSVADRLVFWALAPLLMGRMALYDALLRVPGLSGAVDDALVRKIRRLLARYGHAEFVSDAARYRPTTQAVVAPA